MNHESCADCGFDGGRYDDESLLEAVRALGPIWRALLVSAGPELRVRPATDVRSAIEYAAHSRDVTALHVYAVGQALTSEASRSCGPRSRLAVRGDTRRLNSERSRRRARGRGC